MGRNVLFVHIGWLGSGDSGGLKDRVEALGGTLTIHSRPGHGTRLAVEVPVACPTSQAMEDR
jgi:glucose-6-phosphate-specific signal transduction histidine kinase